MDGNGRWAQSRGLPRALGHRAGAKTVLTIVEECKTLGIEALTLYSFSSENWKRPADEVAALMELCREFIRSQCETMIRNNIRFRRIGRRDGMPTPVLDALDEAERATAHCTALTLCLALNYGSRTELVDATRAIAQRVARGELAPDAITEATIEEHLYTHGLPDPDLLIRTAGERRISNYLLWQISYAELFVANTLWPDFGPSELHEALRDYASRQRRFGDVGEPAKT
ncbi:MAG: di-trans,poly-cis-decaprenylcistransferase [Phycisphaerae bacterium]|jgi:undecaprenyl diphosphate synthase|nr:di-trans,poly-cis-decaprenylcistransferase [Phycisphaerae bacterium]